MTPTPDAPTESARLRENLERALDRLEAASSFAKFSHQSAALDLARRMLLRPDGVEALDALAPRFGPAGVFVGSDWDDPATLLPGLVQRTLDTGEPPTVVLECLSQLRMLAIAGGREPAPGVPPAQARHFLTQVLALNLSRLFGPAGEADRARLGPLGDAVGRLLRHLLEQIGFDDILRSVVDEIERILSQRPIQVGPVKAMVTQMAITLLDGGSAAGDAREEADRLVRALFGPTPASRGDPGLGAYVERLGAMDAGALQAEADGFARSMHGTGLVSDYHVGLVRWAGAQGHADLLGRALGLSSTGRDALGCFLQLVQRLIQDAVHPETAQAVYGLARLLESGALYAPPLAPALWRQIHLELSPHAAGTLAALFGPSQPPRVFLLAGVVELLGLPLGVGQGNNPTCQAARALSMWALDDPEYLLHLVAQAARRDSVSMHFEGRELISAELPAGLGTFHPLDTDPVSTLLVPHLDRLYVAMGRLCVGRGEDPHRWINPEFHGWWVGRDFAIAVDVATGWLADPEGFVRLFYRYHHPVYNGQNPLIHPQPAGLAITDASGDFVGWHAIALLRVALDAQGVMRTYFFNPNNDSGQDWGHGVVVSTRGRGERPGEASLPFAELVSRLYIFHYDADLITPSGDPPEEEVRRVIQMARESWAASRIPPPAAEPAAP